MGMARNPRRRRATDQLNPQNETAEESKEPEEKENSSTIAAAKIPKHKTPNNESLKGIFSNMSLNNLSQNDDKKQDDNEKAYLVSDLNRKFYNIVAKAINKQSNKDLR